MRHLEFERNEENLVKLEGFLKQVNGKKYALKRMYVNNELDLEVCKREIQIIVNRNSFSFLKQQ